MIKKIIKLLAFGLGGLFLILLIGYLFYSIKANRSASKYLTQLGPGQRVNRGTVTVAARRYRHE